MLTQEYYRILQELSVKVINSIMKMTHQLSILLNMLPKYNKNTPKQVVGDHLEFQL